MKLVQKSLTLWISAICLVFPTFAQSQSGSATAEYFTYFNPNNGFKPAQTDLTKIFLQLAGSIEHYGSPEQYIRHVQAENKRISKALANKNGKKVSVLPAYMTDDYFNQLIENWNTLSPKLALDRLAKEAGRCAREGIRGTSDTGTIAIEIFNEHQDQVFESLTTHTERDVPFEQLRINLQKFLESDGTAPKPTTASIEALVKRETTLSASERKQYANLLRFERFSRGEFGELDKFYADVFDKLSKSGQDEISKRVWKGTQKPQPEKLGLDAISSFRQFKTMQNELYARLDAALPPEKATMFKEMVSGFFLDLGQLAHSELEIGILDWSLKP